MDTEYISKNLIRLRQSKNWTQDDIARNLSISRQAISKWETGSSLPNLEMLLKLSKMFNISINEIVEPQKSNYISDFEDIIDIDSSRLKDMMISLEPNEIVKASMGASPKINEFLRQLFRDIDFQKERDFIGSVRISEIDAIQKKIVEVINSQV